MTAPEALTCLEPLGSVHENDMRVPPIKGKHLMRLHTVTLKDWMATSSDSVATLWKNLARGLSQEQSYISFQVIVAHLGELL